MCFQGMTFPIQEPSSYERLGSKPKFSNFKDLHAWVVKPNGEILDYAKRDLKACSLYGTTDLVYVPFEDRLQEKCKKRFNSIYYEDHPETASAMGLRLEEYHQYMVENMGFCMFRSIYLASKNDKLKVVYGSLGFKQTDGSVFYEFG